MSLPSCKLVIQSRLRKPNAFDASRICCQLKKAIASAADREVVRNLDTKELVYRITTGQTSALILDEAYLLVYTVGSPWYADRIMVAEQLLLRIGEGSSFSSIVDLLDDLAQEHNADCILLGGALAKNPRALARMYKRYGYAIEDTPTLIKRR
jgi:hypothetical protein